MSSELRIPDPDKLEAALVAYADGAFGEQDRARATALLDANPALRVRVEDIKREQAALRGQLRREAAPEQLSELHRGRIAVAAGHAAATRSRPWTSPVGLIAAVLCLAVLGGLLVPSINLAREHAPIKVVAIDAPPQTKTAEAWRYGSAADEEAYEAWGDERELANNLAPDPDVGMSSSVTPTTDAAKRDRAWAGVDGGGPYRGTVGQARPRLAPDPSPSAPPASTRRVEVGAVEVTELDLPVEELETEDALVAGTVVPREEAIATSEVGGAGVFMGIGAGGGAAGAFDGAAGGRKPVAQPQRGGERLQDEARPEDDQIVDGDAEPTEDHLALAYLRSDQRPQAQGQTRRKDRADKEGRVEEQLAEAKLSDDEAWLDQVAQTDDETLAKLEKRKQQAVMLSDPDRERINGLMLRAHRANQHGEHATAERIAEQLLRIDRNNADAQRLLVAARRAQATVRHNPWTLSADDQHSTFALDTDVASWGLVRRAVREGRLPAPGEVRIEGIVNAFDYAYPATPAKADATFALHAAAAPAPFGPQGTVLLKLGVKGKVVGRDQQRPAHLVFVVDASGSMGAPDRLPLVRRGLELLLPELGPHDRVTVIATAVEAQLVVDHVAAAQADAILGALDRLQPAGGTNLLAGLELGYAQAAQHFRAGAVNQLLLCSDGVATIGPDDANAVLAAVGGWREQGIGCTTIGVGAGAYDDRMLARLAKDGDGHYHYLDGEQAAHEIFGDQLGATLHGIAKDAKIQVAFDPDRVRRYRLLGYEQREVADVDFRNDAVDAGEIGSGQSATALYELELVPGATDLGQVNVRWQDLEDGAVREAAWRLPASLVRERSASEDPRFHLAACAAELAEILRRSPHAADGDLRAVARRLDAVAAALPLDAQVAELRALCRAAASMIGR